MLCTLQYVKDMLGITSEAQDVALNAFLLAADQVVKTEVDRDLEFGTYTEFYNGTGTKALCLRQTPVVSITSINLDYAGYFGQNPDGPFPSETLLTAGKDYTLYIDKDGKSFSGIVYRINTVWSEINRGYTQGKITQEVVPALGNIKVVYTAGYSVIPADLQQAIVMLIQRARLLIKYGFFLKSEKLGDYAYEIALTMKLPNVLGTVEKTLAKYRRVPW